MDIFLIYILIINLISFVAMCVDKQKAIHHKYRISESTLLFISLIGGSIGGILGMYTFRHKTKKPKFYIGIPAIIVFQLMILTLI